MEITSSAEIHVFRVFAIAKTRNNDANEKSSVPGFDDLVIQWGKDDESNLKESKPDTESTKKRTSGYFSFHSSNARTLVAPLLVLSSNL